MAFDGPRALLLAVFLFFLFLSPDTRNASPSRQRDFDEQVASERLALKVLNESSYTGFDTANDRWLNLTGLRKNDGYAWDLLPKVQERVKEQFQTIISNSPFATRVGNKSTGPTGTISQEHGLDVYSSSPSSMIPFKDPLPMYNNVTSIIRGEWIRSKVAKGYVPGMLNVTRLAPKIGYTNLKYHRNITGPTGDLQINLVEQSSADDLPSDPGLIRRIKGDLEFKDETSSGDGWDVTMFGVHYPLQGSIVLSTTSEKFAGIFALPHFTCSARAFELAQEILGTGLNDTINKQETSFDAALNPWSSSPNNPSESLFPIPKCEFIVYLQQHPFNDPSIVFQDLEDQLRFPAGTPTASVPKIKMSALIFSPDCGFVLESKGPPDYSPADGSHLNGKKIEAYIRAARNFIVVLALLVCIEVLLLKRQMNEVSTPSTKSRISFYTTAMMALGDGFMLMSLVVVGLFVDTLFLPLAATAFLSFLCVSFFGMKFLMDIWTVQAPERQERERERQRLRNQRNAAAVTDPALGRTGLPASSTVDGIPPIITTAGPDSLPLPATARRRADNTTATPIILPPDQDLDAAEVENAVTATTPTTTALGSARREMGALYSKFYFLLLAILSLSSNAISWPDTARSIYCNALAFLYLSFWTPQIYRNLMRNCRKALSWRFVIGQSLLRLSPFFYFYVWDDNILFIETDVRAIFALSSWVWIQIFVLASQEAVGPRFLVPDGWAPPAYDYHPILREAADGDEAGSNMPVGFTEASVASPTSPVVASSGLASSPTTKTRPSRRQNKDDTSKRKFDCAICTDSFEVPVVPTPTATAADGDGAASSSLSSSITIFARRAYMVTPCRHIFHSGCLEGWMRYRLQCPICREGLPPL